MRHAVKHVLAFMEIEATEKPSTCQILTWALLELGNAPYIAGLLVHTLAPEGQPAVTAFQHSQAQISVAVHNSGANKRRYKTHRAPGMRRQTAQKDVVPEILVAREVRRIPGEAMVHDGQIIL